jgi:putative membrane-bound dehydrogenase-like protein
MLSSRRLWSNLAGAAVVAAATLSLVAQSRPQGPAAPRTTPAQRPTPAQRTTPREAEARPLRVLFLGHDQERPHPSPAMFPLLAAPLARRGIQLTHVLTPEEALTPDKLAHYDALMIYGNHTTLTPEQEKALLAFVEAGKGVVAIHSASAMFTSAPAYISLIGGEFQRHGTGEFTAEIVQPNHPVMQGLKPFATWDETYVHTKHNPANRTVLMERVDAQGREPWTWVRTQGKGRVFYTAYGHDQRTWSNPGFHKLIEQATVWAVSEPARRAYLEMKMPEVAYVDGFIVPNYENRDPAPKYQMPFTADESMRFISVPAEFRLELFAGEPDIIEPIAFNFDERGRLWIIEAINYPNVVLNGAPGDDRIKIVEDTNGDGRADRFTVFAEHLNLPTSLVFANGGVVVAAAPHMLFLKDTNGDDKADVRQILSTGWGIRDTHAGPSNLMYGPDNYIWGTVGYSGFNGEMNGKPMQFGQGMFKFRPDGSGFEYVTGSTNNTWGIGMSETFDVFGSTANNDPSFYVAIPNKYFNGVEGLPMPPGGGRGVGAGYQSAAQFYNAHYVTPYIRQVDVFGGYTAAAGHHIYTARAFPKPYWNRIAFITEPTAHLVGQGVLEKAGAGFVTRDGWNLLAGAEEWVAPVQAQVGPDGAVWVSDWYNFIAQHNPTPQGFSNGVGNAYETSMRDESRGRIYRVVYRGAPPYKKIALSKNNVAGLVSALSSDNMLWRLHAQRLLVERGQKDVVPQLVTLLRSKSVDSIGLNGGALHALWTLHGLGELSSLTSEAGRAAVEALKHPAAGVRKAAVMVLPKAAESTAAILGSGVLQDPDLHTRLAVLLTVADMPSSPELGRALYQAGSVAENYSDRWLSRAIFIAATRHKAPFLTEYRADPKAMPSSALPISLRIGTTKPDWRTPDKAALSADWKTMEVPGNWEARGLPDFDGVVWFSRTFDAAQPAAGSLSLGRIANTADVWVNGLSVSLAPPPAAPPGAGPGQGRGRGGAAGAPGGGRGNLPPTYDLPAGTLKAGANTITVRITNNRNDGGFMGTPDSMFVQAGETRVPLGGAWRYRVERQTNAGALYSRPGELAAHVAYAAAPAPATGTLPEPVVRAAPDVTIRLSVTPGEMKYDKTELTVAPGQLVEIVFTNPDSMQHNFVLGAPASLQTIGAAADDLARTPNGPSQQYVPQIPQILFSTKLVEPGETITVQFKAPAQAGDYTYVCTFPGHWRIMNGILHVQAPQGRGRGGAPRP